MIPILMKVTNRSAISLWYLGLTEESTLTESPAIVHSTFLSQIGNFDTGSKGQLSLSTRTVYLQFASYSCY
jgi:hypothetical protein